MANYETEFDKLISSDIIKEEYPKDIPLIEINVLQDNWNQFHSGTSLTSPADSKEWMLLHDKLEMELISVLDKNKDIIKLNILAKETIDKKNNLLIQEFKANPVNIERVITICKELDAEESLILKQRSIDSLNEEYNITINELKSAYMAASLPNISGDEDIFIPASEIATTLNVSLLIYEYKHIFMFIFVFRPYLRNKKA